MVVACFSVEGWGDATYNATLHKYSWQAFVVSGATLLLWVLDARHWHTNTMLCFRNAGLLIAGRPAGCSLATRVCPLAPPCLRCCSSPPPSSASASCYCRRAGVALLSPSNACSAALANPVLRLPCFNIPRGGAAWSRSESP